MKKLLISNDIVKLTYIFNSKFGTIFFNKLLRAPKGRLPAHTLVNDIAS